MFKKIIKSSLWIVMVACVALSSQAQAPKILKIATLAPEGSTLANGLKKLKDEITAKTGGKVTLQIYYGATAGDEKDVVRKMRIGQLNGAALTGVGLGMIEPEIRVLELPFIFRDYGNADKAYAQMKTYFENKLEQKGFVLLGWAEVGFVKIFANRPITSKKDLAGVKMWMWDGDVLAQSMYECLGVVPVPLSVTDVLTSLQTGLIDGAYAPELAAIAFQWHTKASHMTDVNLVDGTGGLVVSKADWAKLSAGEQQIVKGVVDSELAVLKQQTRADNLQAKAVIQSSGITVNALDATAMSELEQAGVCTEQKLVGKLFPQSLVDQVKTSAQ